MTGGGGDGDKLLVNLVLEEPARGDDTDGTADRRLWDERADRPRGAAESDLRDEVAA